MGGRANDSFYFPGLCNQGLLALGLPTQCPLQMYPRPPPQRMSAGKEQIFEITKPCYLYFQNILPNS